MASSSGHPEAKKAGARRSRRRSRTRAARAPFMWGIGATILCLGLWFLGAFNEIEGELEDARWVRATPSAPKISDRVVHVDIDEPSILAVGRWPWNREDLALAIDALHEAGAKTIVLDLILDDPQKVRWRKNDAGQLEEVNDDALLAAAFARAGNVIRGINLTPENNPESPTDGELMVPATVESLAVASAGSGFVNVGVKGQKAVRRVPPIFDIRGQTLLQLGIAAAAHALDVPLDQVRIEDGYLIVGDRRVPVRDTMLVPWHVRRESRDGPATWVKGPAPLWLKIHPHYSISRLVQYERDARKAVGLLTINRPLTQPATAAQWADARSNAEFMVSDYATVSVKDLRSRVEELRARFNAAPAGPERDALGEELYTVENVQAFKAVEAIRTGVGVGGEFSEENFSLAPFMDKVVFIGWQATGALADFYPTALDIRTPGVVVHAAITNGVLTAHRKVDALPWESGLAIIVLGLLAAGIASTLPVGIATPGVFALGAAYAAVNAFGVFDRLGVMLNGAGPLAAVVGAWATCTAVRAIQEAREKGLIRKQFRSRVSSQLVDYLTENPDLMNMEGEEREVTTMFTDFVGFTSISESLEGTATVKLLNVYLGEIAEALMKEGAYVNKFLGDGIMAFWNAPVEQPDHAARGCRAAIAAVATLERVNGLPEYKDLPKLGMRLGISTGKAIVGDCGAPPKLNDYTVIGDPINLAARLESANKLVGTRILVTARTREMMSAKERDALAWRPLGLLRVVGQQKPQEIWELLGPKSMLETHPEIREWVEKTTKAVALFRAGDYAGALPLWQDLVLFERGQAGALLYVERCAELIESGEVNPALPLRSK